MGSKIDIPVVRLPGNEDLPFPAYQSAGAAGLDLHAAISEPVSIFRGQVVAVPCGIAIAIPDGFEGQVRARSGLALKHAITVANSPGTIDSDYRGEVMALLANIGTGEFVVTRGMRIAQLVIAPVTFANLIDVKELPATVRGAGGFGHTGK